MIDVSELSKFFGERRAVGPMSLHIESGEIVGLLGLNGAGKTTTLRMLSSDLLPTSGTIRIDGVDLVEDPDRVRPKIGYLPDRPPLYDEMRVEEYLGFTARLRGMPSDGKTARRVREVMDQTAVGEVRRQFVGTLSHGYRQRLGIAQAIVHRPSLLLLDEPISGLDPVQIVEMRELIRSLHGDHTIVLSSHILPEVSETCDRILVMVAGQVRDAGWDQIRGTLALTLRGDPAVAERAAAATAGVTRVEAIGNLAAARAPHGSAQDDTGVFTLRVASDRDVREALCAALVHADVGVLELSRAERQLEDLFLSLAGLGKGAPAGVKEVAA
ncbi:MAG: ABC transporter ATP-binding protein [Polyangiaceae bacterium]|nr:ABC transporter ATP-binding protein [Polyangiaceae bacterium]